MKFPRPDTETLIRRLTLPEGPLDMVLDTDTYNEIDDQFALVYALRSTDRLNLQAVYAAPFHNKRSKDPKDGMEKSYEEILRVLERMEIAPEPGFIHKGSDRYLESLDTPVHSPAVDDLIRRARGADKPLYVTAIGAITNIASAILIAPDIIDKIVVVWLGGHALSWPHTREFNLVQDIPASRVIFDCGVPLVQIPCFNVASHLQTTIAELERYVDGKSPIGTYLTKIVREYSDDHFAWSKIIWDISAVAFLLNPSWVRTSLVHSPILTDSCTWSVDHRRHFIRTASFLHRDPIFRDLFNKI
jgi:inosine-uridine nucleoside N-ribohydrolase